MVLAIIGEDSYQVLGSGDQAPPGAMILEGPEDLAKFLPSFKMDRIRASMFGTDAEPSASRDEAAEALWFSLTGVGQGFVSEPVVPTQKLKLRGRIQKQPLFPQLDPDDPAKYAEVVEIVCDIERIRTSSAISPTRVRRFKRVFMRIERKAWLVGEFHHLLMLYRVTTSEHHVAPFITSLRNSGVLKFSTLVDFLQERRVVPSLIPEAHSRATGRMRRFIRAQGTTSELNLYQRARV